MIRRDVSCDFVAGEHNVVVPMLNPKTGRVKMMRGMVNNILKPETVKAAGNHVNMVVLLYDTNELVSTHSNVCRKDGKPRLWDQNELEEEWGDDEGETGGEG